MIVVYPNNRFDIVYSDKDTWKEVVAYGQSIGIPLEQLDFKIDEYED